MNLVQRLEQHIADIRQHLDNDADEVLSHVVGLREEEQGSVEVKMAKLKNDWQKMKSYIEKNL